MQMKKIDNVGSYSTTMLERLGETLSILKILNNISHDRKYYFEEVFTPKYIDLKTNSEELREIISEYRVTSNEAFAPELSHFSTGKIAALMSIFSLKKILEHEVKTGNVTKSDIELGKRFDQVSLLIEELIIELKNRSVS